MGAVGLWLGLPDVARLNRPDTGLVVQVSRQDGGAERFSVGERNGLWVRLGDLPPQCAERLIEASGGACSSSWGSFLCGISGFVLGRNGPQRCAAAVMAAELVQFLYPWTRGGGVRRALRELLAFKLCSSLSWRRLLELYFNTARFGTALYGLGEVSRGYYRTDPRFLSAEQCEALGRELRRMRAAR